MENMDKGLTVSKQELIVWPKIPQMPQNLSAQFVCLSPKFWISMKKTSFGVRSPCSSKTLLAANQVRPRTKSGLFCPFFMMPYNQSKELRQFTI